MVKTLLIIVGWIIALIPTWFFLFLKTVVAPVGFWQNFVIYGVGIYFLGSAQLIFLVVAFLETISVILSK